MKARQNEPVAADHLASWGVEGFFGEGGREGANGYQGGGGGLNRP